ncbi:MAG: hypothetical protein QM570_07000, partial [Planctomycetota bacterium]|nr:hypothetical protein [Planctomycetota bacterium]
MAKQYYSLDEVVGSDDNLLTLDQVFGTPQERRQAAQARQQEVMRWLPQTFDAPLSPEQQKRLDGDVKYLIDAGIGIGEAEMMARAAYRAPGGEGVLQSFKKMVSPDENPIGFWEAFVEDPDKFVPVWGTLKGIGELASVLEAAKRLEADAYDTPAEERPYAGPFGGPYAVPG